MNTKQAEIIADISMLAGSLVQEGKLEIEDSRMFIFHVIEWSKEFMEKHEKTNWDKRDYILTVDSFAEKKIKEYKKERVFA